MSLRETYLFLHRQGWLPIFVRDRFDANLLAEACIEAGARVIEVTCRRPGALREIRSIRSAHPELRILAGSTVDSETMVRFDRGRGGSLPSFAELADAGADGFVSQFPFCDETIERFRRSHVLIPGAESGAEAYGLIARGAHFAKLYAVSLFGGPAYVRAVSGAPTHGLLPFFVTGGVSRERIPGYVEAGATLLGGGWDIMLGADYAPLQEKPEMGRLVGALTACLTTFREARRRQQPELATAAAGTDEEYLRAIRHYHPFAEGVDHASGEAESALHG